MHLALLAAPGEALAGGSITENNDALLGFTNLFSVAAQATVTATNGVTETATETITATGTLTAGLTPASTPVPIETQAPPGAGNLKLNPIDWDFLTGVPNPPLGPFAYAFIVLMAALSVVGAYFYFVKRREWKRENHSVHRRAAERWAPMAMWIGALSLLFVVFRMVRFDFFNLRFWLYLWLLAAIGVAIWFYLWYRNTYPGELAKFQKRQRAQQYMPAARKKGSAKSVTQPATATTTTATATATATTESRAPSASTPTAQGATKPVGSPAQRRRKKR